MGSVSISQLASRSLRITATDLPAAGTLVVLQGAVDYAGRSAPAPNTTRVAELTEAQLVAGSARLTIDTRASSFVRTAVRDASGVTVAMSNPVWLLRERPPRGIPAARAA
jgi:hypothetical protein